MKIGFVQDLKLGFLAKPGSNFNMGLGLLLIVYFVLAMFIGFGFGLFEFRPLQDKAVLYLPFSLLIFPSILEETFFRGLLIPRNTEQKGTKASIFAVCLSTIIFVTWHPINALAINPNAKSFALNPIFLTITTLLSITCGIFYIKSKSLWAPILIHWITVLIWVTLLGGRNLVLEI